MTNETEVANIEPETTPVQDVKTESSSESTAEATAQKAVETPFHEHPRFKELVQEKNQLKEMNERLQQQAFELVNRTQNPQQQIQEQIVEAKTPEEKTFWELVHKVAKVEAEKTRKDAEKIYQSEIQGYQKMVGTVIADRFIEKNPEIEKGSENMKQIIHKSQEFTARGFDITESLEMAKRYVMFDKIGEMAVQKSREKEKQKTQQKQQAVLETNSVPEKAIPKGSPGLAISMDDLMATAKQLGIEI